MQCDSVRFCAIFSTTLHFNFMIRKPHKTAPYIYYLKYEAAIVSTFQVCPGNKQQCFSSCYWASHFTSPLVHLTHTLLFSLNTTIHSNMYNCVQFTVMDFFYIYICGTFSLLSIYHDFLFLFFFFFLVIGICNTCFVLQDFVLL